MRDTIVLTGLTARGHHGVFEAERADGQRFVVDLTLHVDLRPAGTTDDLDETVDYGAVADAVVGVVTGPPYDLIEAVAEEIARRVLEGWPAVEAAEVTVHKPEAPITQTFEDVAVRIVRGRTG